MNAHSLHQVLFFWTWLKPAPVIREQVTKHNEKFSIRLRRNQVMTIDQTSVARSIEVKHGAVWLTGTPAGKDVVLQAKESFCLTHHYPFVIEALSDTEITLAE
jgi:hypothetical protein